MPLAEVLRCRWNNALHCRVPPPVCFKVPNLPCCATLWGSFLLGNDAGASSQAQSIGSSSQFAAHAGGCPARRRGIPRTAAYHEYYY